MLSVLLVNSIFYTETVNKLIEKQLDFSVEKNIVICSDYVAHQSSFYLYKNCLSQLLMIIINNY